MDILTNIRKALALPFVVVGLLCLVFAAWLAIDDEDWSETYASRKT